MTEKYLQERLTESKLTSAQWKALAECLEGFWRLHFADIEAFEADKNIFTASHAELDKKIRDFGDYFDVELPFDDSTKRLAIAWRRDSIHKKNTLSSFLLSLKLNFAGLPIHWEPSYCLGDYTNNNLVTEALATKEAWLTSRGQITIDVSHLKKIKMSRDQFTAIVEREIQRLKPLHIVYDGVSFTIYIEFVYEPLIFNLDSIVSEREPRLNYHSYFFVDRDITTTEHTFTFKLKRMLWSLDQFIPLPSGKIPLPGIEGDVIEVFDFISFKDEQISFNLPISLVNPVKEKTENLKFTYKLDYHFDDEPSDSVSLDIRSLEMDKLFFNETELHQLTTTNSDPKLYFDSIPSDFFPLDHPFWEQDL